MGGGRDCGFWTGVKQGCSGSSKLWRRRCCWKEEFVWPPEAEGRKVLGLVQGGNGRENHVPEKDPGPIVSNRISWHLAYGSGCGGEWNGMEMLRVRYVYIDSVRQKVAHMAWCVMRNVTLDFHEHHSRIGLRLPRLCRFTCGTIQVSTRVLSRGKRTC